MSSSNTEDDTIHIPQGMTPEQIRDAEYRALVQGQHQLIQQMLEISRSQKAMEKRYDHQLKDMAEAVDKNTNATNAVKTDTADLVAAIKAVQGGMAVLAWLGKATKPILFISLPGAFLLALWHGFGDWFKALTSHRP